MSTAGYVTTQINDSIATISFYHPQSNSLPSNLLNELATEVTAAGLNPSVKVIVLRSEGTKAFCAGASFDELMAISNIDEGRRFFSGFANVINAMRKAPKFIIARVQGKTVGGGVGLAAAADYTIAHQSASVKLSELAVGIGPFVVGPAVQRKIGTSAFMKLAINATEWQLASWAKVKGLFCEVYESLEEVDNHVEQLAAQLASSGPEAMRQLKAIGWEGTENWDILLTKRAEISGTLILTDYAKNAISKFKAGSR